MLTPKFCCGKPPIITKAGEYDKILCPECSRELIWNNVEGLIFKWNRREDEKAS